MPNSGQKKIPAELPARQRCNPSFGLLEPKILRL